jgi:hypothetical protein
LSPSFARILSIWLGLLLGLGLTINSPIVFFKSHLRLFRIFFRMDLASFRGRSTLTLTFPYQTVVEIDSISTNPVLSTKFVHGFAESGRAAGAAAQTSFFLGQA